MNQSIKASELILMLQNIIDKHGDIQVFKEKNGNPMPIHCVEYFRNENHFELI